MTTNSIVPVIKYDLTRRSTIQAGNLLFTSDPHNRYRIDDAQWVPLSVVDSERAPTYGQTQGYGAPAMWHNILANALPFALTFIVYPSFLLLE